MALIKDQVQRLLERGLNVYFYTSRLSDEEQQSLLHTCTITDFTYKIILTTPESMISSRMRRLLDILYAEKTKVQIVVDEAHCIDTWGSSFRLAYRQLAFLKDDYESEISALTGTATKHTIEVIKKELKLINANTITMPFIRNNISIKVIRKPKEPKESICSSVVEQFIGQRGIIYCQRQSETVEMSYELKLKGITAVYFHGGMEDIDKEKSVEFWFARSAGCYVCD